MASVPSLEVEFAEAILIDSHNIWFYGELMVIMQKISYYRV